MPQSPRRYTEEFKRQAVARMTASPGETRSIAHELNVSRTLLYKWRKQFSPSAGTERGPGGEVAVRRPGGEVAVPAPSFSPSAGTERGPGGEVGVRRPGGEVAARGPGVRALGVRTIAPEPGGDALLRQTLLNSALTLAAAVDEAAASAPLNQLSAALGLIIDRLLKLDALAAHQSSSFSEGVIQIEYLDSDGSVHRSPPWARGDPAFEEPISRGRVRSPFWEDRGGEADDPGDGPARS